MKEMPYLLREEPCTCDLSENHAAGLSTHAVHSDGHVHCRYDGGFPWWMLADKHLSDVECAAEYWHTAYYALEPIVQSVIGDLTVTPEIDTATRRQSEEAMIWHRFATHPHARERDYQ